MKKRVLSLPVTGDFSFTECLWFLHRGFDECLHRLGGGRIRKALRAGDEKLLVEVSHGGDGVRVELLVGEWDDRKEAYVRQYVHDWIDLESDIQPFYRLLAAEKALTYMPVKYKGLRLIGMPDLFQSLSWAIIGQQINLSFAYKTKRRLVERYGELVEHQGERYLLFPTAATLAAADPAELRAMQFSVRKAEYLITLARAFSDGTLSKQRLLDLPDLAARQQLLTDIRGIGIWTANYGLMKSLGEWSCIPHGDVGLLNALLAHRVIRDKTDKKAIERFFRKFKGYEAYAVHYLWRSLAPTVAERQP